jgi:hypothetical protein
MALAGQAGLAACVLLSAGRAAADPQLSELTSRNFTLDLGQGSVVASHRIVGMGGTSLAIAEGADFMIDNPAAVAIRPATVNGSWDWDFLIDKLEPGLGTDADNNGVAEGSGGLTSTSAFGLMFYFGHLGAGASLTLRSYDGLGSTGDLRFDADVFRLHFGWTLGEHRDVGMGVNLVVASLQLADDHGDGNQYISQVGASLEMGIDWQPFGRSFRGGARLGLPVDSRLRDAKCDPMDCFGLILPEGAQVPVSGGLGIAVRLASTPWNQRIQTPFRDERNLILAADLVLYGPLRDGANIESFTHKQLQDSGHFVTASIRGGFEAEVVPGWVRLRGGAYWEPSRVEGVDGRAHGTAGFDARLFEFHLAGAHRLRVSGAIDYATGYVNVVASLGFWH